MNTKMLFYLGKRILLGLVTIIVVITITFFAMNAIPGGPFQSEKAVDAATLERLNEMYGLNDPLFLQYIRYLGNALIWNFGYSIKSRGSVTVLELIMDGFPYSLATGLTAAAIAIILGIVLGSTAALKHNKTADRIIMVCSTASVAMPSFVIASLLLWLFCSTLNWLPIGGETWQGYILPVVTLCLSPMAYITRLTRSSTLDVLGADYIRTAQAKGVSKSSVLFKHALRNSLTPVITYAGPMIAGIITGSIVVEKIFAVKGVGRTFVNYITSRDYPVIMGTTIFLTYLVIIMVLVSDILYKVVNPRVELD